MSPNNGTPQFDEVDEALADLAPCSESESPLLWPEFRLEGTSDFTGVYRTHTFSAVSNARAIDYARHLSRTDPDFQKSQALRLYRRFPERKKKKLIWSQGDWIDPPELG